jgi:hypothetical protein
MKALPRIAVLYNVPIACNRATADLLLSSPLMPREYERMTYAEQALQEAAAELQEALPLELAAELERPANRDRYASLIPRYVPCTGRRLSPRMGGWTQPSAHSGA